LITDGSAGQKESPAAEIPLRRNRDFLLLWSGAGMALLGTRVSAIAYPLLVLWSTGSASAAGLVGFAAQLPALLIQLPAGALVDRWDRRRLMIFCNLGGALMLGSTTVSVALGAVWIPQLMLAAFVESSLTIFYTLSERGGVRNLVPKSQLPTALSQNEARGRVAALCGQPLGSLVFGLGQWLPFAFTSFSHVFALAGLACIKKDLQTARKAKPDRVLLAIREGISWVWRQRFLRAVMALIAGSNIVLNGLSLVVLVIVHAQGASPAIVSMIVAVRGLGGLLGALTGTWWLRATGVRFIVVGGNLAWAVLVPLVMVVTEPIALAVIFGAASFVGGAFNVAGGVYQIQRTPDSMQGRVNSVMNLLGSGANSLGILVTGFLLDAQGATRTAGVLSALMVAVAIAAVVSPAVRHEGRTPAA
jgi:MFS family permease